MGAVSWISSCAVLFAEPALLPLDDARTTLRSESQTLSTNLSTITIRQDFTKGMINTLEDGAAELTNADMNQEGANMLMLQTRQSLGTTSLSLASQAAQSVLRLF
jgi:flagellin